MTRMDWLTLAMQLGGLTASAFLLSRAVRDMGASSDDDADTRLAKRNRLRASNDARRVLAGQPIVIEQRKAS